MGGPELKLKPLPPREAVAYFKGKGFSVTNDWRDLWEDEHAKAFTVAKVASLDLLQAVHEELGQALAQGLTRDQFRARMAARLQAEGWLGTGSRDPEGGARLARPGRLDLIYDANLRTAHATGQWARIQRLKDVMPFLRYETMGDARVRPAHAAWDGIVRPVGDPFWTTHTPPNGWRCRCRVSQWDEEGLQGAGFKPTPADHMPPEEVVTFTSKRTGELSEVPTGIDPGWAYNPGQAGAAALLDATRTKLEGFSAELTHRGLQELVHGPGFSRWLDAAQAGTAQGRFPVLRLPEALEGALGEGRSVATLSGAILRKTLQDLPDLSAADFSALPALGADPDLVVTVAEGLVLARRGKGGAWMAVVTPTGPGGELEVQGCMPIPEGGLRLLEKRGKVVLRRTGH